MSSVDKTTTTQYDTTPHDKERLQKGRDKKIRNNGGCMKRPIVVD